MADKVRRRGEGKCNGGEPKKEEIVLFKIFGTQ